MGNKQSKRSTTETTPQSKDKSDKIVNDEKLLKIGVGLGRGDLRVEGNFQMGWHRRCNKKYVKPDKVPLIENMDRDPEALLDSDKHNE